VQKVQFTINILINYFIKILPVNNRQQYC